VRAAIVAGGDGYAHTQKKRNKAQTVARGKRRRGDNAKEKRRY